MSAQDAQQGHMVAETLPQHDVVGAITDGAHNGGGLNGQDAYSGRIMPVCFNSREDPEVTGDRAGPLGSSSPQAQAVAFKPSHYTRGKDGAPSEVVPPLSADADKGDQDPVLMVPEVAGTMKSMAQSGGWSNSADHAAAGYMLPVAFVQNTRDEVRLMGGDGGIAGALAAEPGAKQQCYLAQPYSIMPMNSGKDYKARPTDVAQPIMAGGPVGGNQGGDFIAQPWAVRRLTPTETLRLQGFPDGYTQIPWRGKPAELCPDGPQYKSHGNSMAVPVMRWLGTRIEMVETLMGELSDA